MHLAAARPRHGLLRHALVHMTVVNSGVLLNIHIKGISFKQSGVTKQGQFGVGGNDSDTLVAYTPYNGDPRGQLPAKSLSTTVGRTLTLVDKLIPKVTSAGL